MQLTGAQIVIECLKEQKVDTVFGYPGGAILNVYDELYKHQNEIRHVLTSHEQGASHAADGYARSTGKVGVCFATSGPGATNLVTGIATAYMDSIPMVALTGQVATKLIGKDAFQEVDITGATLPFTKHSYLIKDGLDIPRVVNEAFHIANTGRPGPVLIDFPMDLLKKEFDYPEEDEDVNIRGYKLMGKANESQVKKVAEAIKGAKKPVILAGGGVVISDATNEFRKFVKETDIPVVSTMMGIGILPSDNPRYYGMIGSHGVKRANLLFNRADLVIVMGSRLGDRTVANVKGLEEGNKLIHIDLDPAEIGKNTQPYIPVVGDIKDVLEQLTSQISGYKTSKEWIDEADELRQRFTHKPVCEDNGFVNPKYFLNVLSEKTNSDVYLSTEVGQNQIWCANNFNFKTPRSLLTSGGFGTMGYSIPAAIGVRAALPDTQIVAVCGDGSFQMSLMELATMRQWDLPIKFVIMRNGYLGLVREYQHHTYHDRYSGVSLDGSPDFEKIAEAYGLDYFYLEHNDEMEQRIDEFLACDHAAMMVCEVYSFDLVKE